MDSIEAAKPEGERLRSAVSAAIADVDALGLTGSDRAVSLAVVLATRLGVTVAASNLSSPDDKPTANGHPGAGVGPAVVEDGMVGRIAAALKVERDVADMVYDDKNGELGYVISARRLASDKANATRQLAQVIAAGRQAAGLEEWTPVSVVREIVNDYGKLDAANFASYIGALDKNNAVLLRGKGASRELKVTRSGFESVAELVTSLVVS
jgi:hypothetical protein